MGEVWRAAHCDTGLAAAVKVVAAATPSLAVALQHEIRASAALSDPHIVRLYDAGIVSQATHGLQAGVPWLAMELLEGGTLSTRALNWGECRRILDDLLGALAHAHAAGLLHRDLKPDNVLFDAEGSTRLVDFGIGVRLDEAGSVRPSGTPSWMAPEQFERGGRQLGPWTDLYAIGCLAYWMTSGRPPYAGDTVASFRKAHCERVFPELEPQFPVPDGFGAWIGQLTAKAPRERVRRAADARATLSALVDPHATPLVSRRAAAAATLIPLQRGTVSEAPAALDLAPTAAGLGLVRLREAPLAGRSAELARLRAAFALAATGSVQIVALCGPTGAGKTRLANGLCREVHASGEGTPFRASHAPSHGDGLAGLLARALRIDASDPAPEVAQRIAQAGLPFPLALAEVVRPTAGGAGAPLEQRCERVADALLRLAEGRVPVVWIDDAQWSLEGLALTRHLATRDEAWLVVLTSRLPLDLPGAEIVPLAPLNPQHASELADGLAPLASATRADLVRHARGSPLFLVELVGEWVGRGLLAPGTEGWALARDPSAWPTDLPALWRGRLLRVLAHREGWLEPLAVAAALGAEVDNDEFARACARGGLSAPESLVTALFSERLASPDPAYDGRRWSLVHPSLREAVVALAGERALLASAHRACAAMLEAGSPATEERRAGHLEAAGDAEAAIDALLVARAWNSRRDLAGATRVLDRATALLEALPGDVKRLGEVWIARSRVGLMRGDYREAATWIERAQASSDRRIRAFAQVERGRLCRLLDGEPEVGIADLRAGALALRALGETEMCAVALGELGITLRDFERFDEASAALDEAVTLAADPARKVELSVLRAGIFILQHRLREALAHLDGLDAALASPDLAFPRASWLYHRGHAYAGLHLWERAESDLREAVDLRYRMGSRAGSWRDTWAMALLELGRNAEAQDAVNRYETGEDRGRFPIVFAALAAVRGEWTDVPAVPPPANATALPELHHAVCQVIARAAAAAGRDDLAAAYGARWDIPAAPDSTPP